MEQNVLNLSIFGASNSNHCNNDSNEKCISSCACMKRIALALKFYYLVNQDRMDKDQFIQFCQKKYTSFLDDYFHFIEKHNYQLQQIRQELELDYSIKCEITECDVITRHYRSERTEISHNQTHTTDTDDFTYSFYVDCFDRIHHQIFHLEALGLRVENEGKKKDDDGKMNDDRFENMTKKIFSKRQEFGSDRFERLQKQGNKFMICKVDESTKNSGIFCHIFWLVQHQQPSLHLFLD